VTNLISRLANRVRAEAVAQGGRVEPLTEKVQQVANSRIDPKFLTTMLNRQDRSAQASRQGKEGHIHVSSLIGFCPRRQVLMQSYSDRQDHVTSTHGGMQVVWAMGRAAETHVRAQIIADRRADVYGIWKCKCERASHVGFWSLRNCPKCDTPLNTYNEHPLADEEAGVVGNPDLLMRVGTPLLVTEIKSMNKKEWDAIEAPKGDHIFQAGWYVNILRRNGFLVHDVAHVIYVVKDFVFGSPYKEFAFDACTPERLAMIEQSRQMAITSHAANKAGTIPANTLCSSPTGRMAKDCPALVSCFNRG
jgi:hypothetical protein